MNFAPLPVSRYGRGLAVSLFAALAVALYASADRSGGFWWFDSASHAFNGIFLLDFFRDGAFLNPLEWAVRYFDQYPAITLGFYPPGFAVLLLPFYLLLGPTHAAAQALMATSAFALALGTWQLGVKLGWGDVPALAAAVLLVTFPEMLLWERQIQPEIPSYALAVWGCCLWLDWLDRGGKRIYGAVVLLVAALYVKQTIVFILPVLGFVAVARIGRSLFRSRPLMWASALGFVLLLPLAGLSIAFGGMNLSQATAAPQSANWFFYLRTLPQQIGTLALICACLGAVLLIRDPRVAPATQTLLFGWIVLGLSFFSVIALKSARFSTAVLPAIALSAAFPLTRIQPWRGAKALSILAVCGIGSLNLINTPVPVADGLTEAAAVVAASAPPDSSVLLLAHRSSNFIFNLKAYHARPDLRVVRAEKLFTSYRVHRDFGVIDKAIDCEAILPKLAQNNIAVLAIEHEFWSDLPTLGCLHRSVEREPFDRIASIPLITRHGSEKAGSIEIYRRKEYTPQRQPDVTIDVPLIGLHITVPAKSAQHGDNRGLPR